MGTWVKGRNKVSQVFSTFLFFRDNISSLGIIVPVGVFYPLLAIF